MTFFLLVLASLRNGTVPCLYWAPLSISVASKQAIRVVGGVPGAVKADLDPLLRRLDTSQDGRVSLRALMEWSEREYVSTAGVENAVSVSPPL